MKFKINEKNISLNEYAAYSWILCELFSHIKIDTLTFKEIKAVIRENMKEILSNYGFKGIKIKDTALIIRFLGHYQGIYNWLDEKLCDGTPLDTPLRDLADAYYNSPEYNDPGLSHWE